MTLLLPPRLVRPRADVFLFINGVLAMGTSVLHGRYGSLQTNEITLLLRGQRGSRAETTVEADDVG